MQKYKKLFTSAIALSLALSCSMATPALAIDYSFDGSAPGKTFYQSTSADTNYIADNGQIVVGTDGTISGGVTGNQTSGPASTIDIPVGEFPEAYGFETDMDIALNSVFPNELGPTTQNSNYYKPIFTPTVEGGQLPTGHAYLPTVYSPSFMDIGAYNYAGFTNVSLAGTVYGSYAPLSAYSVVYPYAAASTYPGLATSISPMPTITKKGAIGRLCIPSIGLNCYAYEGTSSANMLKGVAHFDSTPGMYGNIALAGHNRGNNCAFFAHLKDVKLGDMVTYTTAYGTNSYVVSNITTCATTDTSGLLQDGTNKITMYTCKAGEPDVKLCVVATMVGSV